MSAIELMTQHHTRSSGSADDDRLDPLLTLSVAARLPWLPKRRRGAHPSPATLWRWANKGVAGVTLRTLTVGPRTLVTTERWLRRFFEDIAATRSAGESAVPTSVRRLDPAPLASATRATLARAGILDKDASNDAVRVGHQPEETQS